MDIHVLTITFGHVDHAARRAEVVEEREIRFRARWMAEARRAIYAARPDVLAVRLERLRPASTGVPPAPGGSPGSSSP